MFFKRIIVILILLPLGLAAIFMGSPIYTVLIAAIMGLAAWEYSRLFHAGGLHPSNILLVAGAVALTLGRAADGFESTPWLLSLAALVSMTYHLVAFEKGQDQAGTDFSITLSGILYFGFIGAYLISLRDLPEGVWWLLVVLPTVWLADGGAYLVGSRWGRHKMSPRLSPKKSWEGYFGGILFSVIGGILLVNLYGLWLEPQSALTPTWGALIGFVMGVIPTLGDLGESMFKRQVHIKDSGNLLPGHGGVFDRIDSWLWAGVIGYYMIVWLILA